MSRRARLRFGLGIVAGALSGWMFPDHPIWCMFLVLASWYMFSLALDPGED